MYEMILHEHNMRFHHEKIATLKMGKVSWIELGTGDA
jgi:hypothetical protein